MNILAIESSCDETASAVIRDGRTILSQAVATSTAMYAKYGGIVPEVAAREQLEYVIPVISEALSGLKPGSWREVIATDIDAIAVTSGPGLIGSLLIGIEAAKTLAFVTGKPLIPVNHVLAHMYANFLDVSHNGTIAPLRQGYVGREAAGMQEGHGIRFPAISLVVSGGHTELYLMKSERELRWLGGTTDDAAGEAFDKTARLLGFGSRGGLAIQEAARKAHNGESGDIPRLPRPLMHDGTLNFSFSGLKTAVMRGWEKSGKSEYEASVFSREIQEAITDVLVGKTLAAVGLHNADSVLIAGGVSANTRLREKMESGIALAFPGVTFHAPPVNYCTDNAAYIGSYAFFRGVPAPWETIAATPGLSVEVES